MKNWKKLCAVALVFTMAIASITGCSKKSKTGDTDTTLSSTETSKDVDTTDTTDTQSTDADTTEVVVQDVALKVWVPEEEQEFTVTMCEAFAANHPEYNITFEYAVMGVDESIDALKKDAEVAADVFIFPSGGVPELVEAGLIYPITVDADAIKSAHGEAAIKSCTLDDLLYGVPETPNSWFMYYNSSLYTEDEVKSLETMLAKDLGADSYNFSSSISNSWYMSAFFYAAGGTLYGANGDDPTDCSWNDATGYKVGQYLINLASHSKYVEDIDGIAASLFKEGKLGALCSGTWSADDLKTALGDNYAAAKLPTINIDGTDYQLSNFADFKAFGVKSSTQFPEAAQKLAAWLGGEESQLTRFEAISTPPTVTALLTNESVIANKAVAALSEQTTYSTPNPTTSQLSQYWTPAGAFGSGIINGDITESNLQESLDALVTNFLSTLTE